MAKELMHIIENWESSIEAFTMFDFSYLEELSQKDSKLEEGMVSFIIHTLPGDLAILKIDTEQKDWKNLRSSLTKISAKMEMIGALKLVELCERLSEKSKVPLVRNAIHKEIKVLIGGVEQSIRSLSELFLSEEQKTLIRKIA